MQVLNVWYTFYKSLFPANPLRNPQDTRDNKKRKHGHQEALTGLFITVIIHENNTKVIKIVPPKVG